VEEERLVVDDEELVEREARRQSGVRRHGRADAEDPVGDFVDACP
jgi:hypothetical protein